MQTTCYRMKSFSFCTKPSPKSKNPDFPCDSYDPFKLENMDEAECKAEFRVEKNDLHGLVPGT